MKHALSLFLDTTGIVSDIWTATSMQSLCTSIHNAVCQTRGNHNSQFPTHWDCLYAITFLEVKQWELFCISFTAVSLPIFPPQTRWLGVYFFEKERLHHHTQYGSKHLKISEFWAFYCNCKRLTILPLFTYNDVTSPVPAWY